MAHITDQPDPVANQMPHIADLVIADMAERKQIGIQRYKTALQPFNGRDALVDAYQEALDLTMYLRQVIEERYRLSPLCTCQKVNVGSPAKPDEVILGRPDPKCPVHGTQ